MKKLFASGAFAFSALLSTLIAGTYDREIGTAAVHAGFDVVASGDLTNETLEKFFSGKSPDIVIECSEGMNLPLKLCLEGDYFGLSKTDKPPYMLTVWKTCYIRHVENQFLFSPDLQNWKSFEGFFTGKFGVAVDVQAQGLEVSLGAELNERK